MQRAFRIIGKLVLGAFVATATVIVGLVVHRNFSWPELEADIGSFVDAIGSGDSGTVIAALASGPVVGVSVLLCLGAGLVLEWLLRRRRA